MIPSKKISKNKFDLKLIKQNSSVHREEAKHKFQTKVLIIFVKSDLPVTQLKNLCNLWQKKLIAAKFRKVKVKVIKRPINEKSLR